MYTKTQKSFACDNYIYHVSLSIPTETEGALPVLYVLDGEAYGVLFERLIVLQSRRQEKTKIPKAIIVSIEAEEWFPKWRYDVFTPPSKKNIKNGDPGKAISFIKMLQEIKQWIQKEVEVDFQKEIIFGHSLAGLFLTYVLKHHPQLFCNYYIVSPSLWWENEKMLKEDFSTVSFKGNCFLASEVEHRRHMHTLTKQFAVTLQDCTEANVKCVIDEEENHMSIIPTTAGKALRFLWSTRDEKV